MTSKNPFSQDSIQVRLATAGVKNIIGTEMATKVTPNMASELLQMNTHNRNLNKALVDQFAEAMKRGEWVNNGRTIVFSDEGILLDGQHTLTAVAQSGKTVPLFIAMGIDPKAQETMDGGRKRSFGDALHLRGVKNSNTVAAVTRMVWSWENHGIPSPQNVRLVATNQQLFAALDKNSGIIESTSKMSNKEAAPWFITQSITTAMHYIFSLFNEDDAEKFFEILASGKDLSEGDPIFTLRERLIREQGDLQKLSQVVKMAFIVRAFNAWRNGEELRRLQFKAGGATPDRFPHHRAPRRRQRARAQLLGTQAAPPSHERQGPDRGRLTTYHHRHDVW